MLGFHPFSTFAISDIGASLFPPSISGDKHDGFTPEDIKRAKELDKKLEKARKKLLEAKKQYKADRKKKIDDLVNPKVVEKPNIKPIIKATQEIKAVELERHDFSRELALRQHQARIQMQLAILNMQRMALLDDEESILALLL